MRNSRAVVAWNVPEEWEPEYARRIGVVYHQDKTIRPRRREISAFVSSQADWDSGKTKRLTPPVAGTLAAFYDACGTPARQRFLEATPPNEEMRVMALEAFERDMCEGKADSAGSKRLSTVRVGRPWGPIDERKRDRHS
jgi:hypothetical protein